MHRTLARIASIRLEADGSSLAKITCPPQAIPASGQFSLAFRPGDEAPLRSALFPIGLEPNGFTTAAEQAWQPGGVLDLLGPVGRGFRPPSQARRWALAGIGRPLDRLLPLLQQGLKGGANIAVWSTLPAVALPAQVEIVRDEADALAWADYIAFDVSPESLVGLGDRLNQALGSAPSASIQVLVAPAMPCGLGLCQACAIAGHRGGKLACRDGPVFDWPVIGGTGKTA
jgi:NAD(P)H-flavin reductase